MPKNIDKALLDKLAEETGKVINENEVVVKEGEELQKFADAQLSAIKEEPKFEYGGADCPMPGENITEQFESLRDVDKENAAQNLVMQNALVKARKESEASMTPEERRQKRQQIIDQMMYNAEEEYFVKHKYIMDGQTKRRTRAMIERNYDKGRYRPKTSGSGLNG